MPVLVSYFRDEIGLTFQDFLITESVFAFVVVALEVPSGWLSDVWKRKYVIVLSQFFWLLSGVILLLAHNLEMAILSQSIMGVAASLKSGTDSAMLYDSLLVDKKNAQFSRFEGRRKGYALYSSAVAFIFGGFMYEIDHDLPMYFMIACHAVAFFLSLFLREPPRHKVVAQHNPFIDMMNTMRYALHGHTRIAMIIFFGAVLFSGTKVVMWLQQLYYIELGLPEGVFGILMAVGSFMGGLASHVGHLIEKKLSYFKGVVLAWFCTTSVCLGAAIEIGYIGVGLLMIGGTFVYGATYPMLVSAINNLVGSERRATILSTLGLLVQLTFVPLGFLAGWFVSMGGVSLLLYVMTLWLSFAGVGLAIWHYKRNYQ